MRGFANITRRALLGQLACAAAFAQTQTEKDPLRQLRPGHPRLLLPDSELDKLRILIREHPLARRIYSDFEKECDRLLSIPPIDYKLNGPRLQPQTRRAIDRISTLSLMYRLTGRDPWLRRAIMEMNAAANFKDWNPARSNDMADLASAFAIGYDWLYNSLSPDERTLFRDAIVTKALDPAAPIYEAKIRWVRDHSTANLITNSGLLMAALSVADEVPDKAFGMVRATLESVAHGLSTWGPDSAWAEGPYFAEQATRAASLYLATLETAMGTDFGLASYHGIDRAGRLRVYSISPSNRMFNYGDGGEEPGNAPEMFYMARRFNQPTLSWSEQKQLERGIHADALDLTWFSRDARAPQPPAWPLDAVFPGALLATFRTSWEDTNALFFGIRGGDNKATRGHLDMGSFVLDAGGVRWAIDPPLDDLPIPVPQRPTTPRVRTDVHNTIMIEGENQDAKAEARLLKQDLTPEASWVQFDLSKAYPAKLKAWTRRAGLLQRQAVLIQDTIRADQPVEVDWGMTTDAEITVTGNAATLRKNGWYLSAEIRTPRHAVFDIAPVRPAGQQGNSNLKRLVVKLADKVTDLDLNILLTPYREGQSKPAVTAQFPGSLG